MSEDRIDKLLNEKTVSKKDRVQRSFYMDVDVLKAIDRVADGKKSDLVNEILRAEFKDRGIL